MATTTTTPSPLYTDYNNHNNHNHNSDNNSYYPYNNSPSVYSGSSSAYPQGDPTVPRFADGGASTFVPAPAPTLSEFDFYSTPTATTSTTPQPSPMAQPSLFTSPQATATAPAATPTATATPTASTTSTSTTPTADLLFGTMDFATPPTAPSAPPAAAAPATTATTTTTKTTYIPPPLSSGAGASSESYPVSASMAVTRSAAGALMVPSMSREEEASLRGKERVVLERLDRMKTARKHGQVWAATSGAVVGLVVLGPLGAVAGGIAAHQVTKHAGRANERRVRKKLENQITTTTTTSPNGHSRSLARGRNPVPVYQGYSV